MTPARPRLVLVVGIVVFLTAACLLLGGHALPAWSEPPPSKALTAEQRERLKERDRLRTEVKKLGAAGKMTEAIPVVEKILVLERELFGPVHPDIAESLVWLARLREWHEDFEAARKARKEVLNITARLHGRENWRVTDARLALANLELLAKLTLDQRQRLRQAQADDQRMVALYGQGRYDEALLLAEYIVKQRRLLLGDKHFNYADSLNALAVLHYSMGDYARAEPLYRQTRDIRKHVLGDQHPRYALSLDNLALLYFSMGDYARAEPLFRQARDIRKQAPGDQHPHYANSLTNLARLYYSMGDYAQAEPLFRQALDIRKQALGDKHPDYAISLNNLAGLYHAMGAYAKAEPLYLQARDIYKQTLGDKHPDYALCLGNLAELYAEMGAYAKAEPLFRQTLLLRKQTLGDQHLDYALSLGNLAMLYLAKNEDAQGLKLARQAWRIVHAQLNLTANVQSERQQLRMNERLRSYLYGFLSVAAAAKAPAEEVYAEVLAWKGSVSLRQQQMRRLRRQLIANDPKSAPLYAHLEAATRRLATLVNTTPAPKQLAGYRERLDEANAEVERLQKELAAASATFRKDQEQRRHTPTKLRQALPDGVALVDLLEYPHFMPGKGRGRWERRLTAFIVRADQPVKWIDLGAVEPLAEAIEQWREGLPQRRKPVFDDDEDPAVKLRRLLWEPLEPHLKDSATVLLSPDGVVARLPWGALPGATPDKYLLEERSLAVIAVLQFLPELLAGDKKSDAGPPALLLVGDVDYGAAPGKEDVEIASRGLATVLQRGGGLSWKRLPATKQEAAAIRDLFQRCFPDGTARLLEQEAATEGAVRRQASRHVWLHLATHGYFAPRKVQSALGQGKKRAEPMLSLAEQKGFVGFPQGLLAGVVLAGANTSGGDGEDDGVLTALEVAELDLHGVELAVLSACETGLGKEAGGEGVLGLQRAFQVAGARGVVASLWQVPDEATRVLMERFYANVWQKKLGRLAALREAQLWLLREGVKRPELLRGGPKPLKSGSMPPLYWAAFVLSGDWR